MDNFSVSFVPPLQKANIIPGGSSSRGDEVSSLFLRLPFSPTAAVENLISPPTSYLPYLRFNN